jgi:hypothetical protein
MRGPAMADVAAPLRFGGGVFMSIRPGLRSRARVAMRPRALIQDGRVSN